MGREVAARIQKFHAQQKAKVGATKRRNQQSAARDKTSAAASNKQRGGVSLAIPFFPRGYTTRTASETESRRRLALLSTCELRRAHSRQSQKPI